MRKPGGLPWFGRRLGWLSLPLVLVMVVVARPVPLQASPLPRPLYVRLSLSGYIMEKSAGQWRIDATVVSVDARTVVDESQYRADLYAYVGVTASYSDGQVLPHADTITVLRPADAGGILVQLAGPMKGATAVDEWSVAGQLVKVPQQIYPAAPPEGALVSIIAEDRTGTLWAMRVEVVAGDPNSVPVEFEGQVTNIDPDLQTWLIDKELTVSYNALTSYPGGTPSVGDTIEVRARLAAGGKLTAEIANVKAQGTQAVLYAAVTSIAGSPGGTQTWTLQAPTLSLQATPEITNLEVDQNTWIDRRHAQPAKGTRAEVHALKRADGSYHAEVVRLDQPRQAQPSGAFGAAASQLPGAATAAVGGTAVWSSPTPISEHLSQASGPALAYTNDGIAHAVWETDGELLYASRPPTGTWSMPSRVAAGTMPALLPADDGTLHLVFSHTFMGNDEIYYVTQPPAGHWTLPVNVSHTSGKSYMPSLAITPDHELHVAWMDNSPGNWVVYYGALANEFWSSVPVPNGRGEVPDLAAGTDGALYLAWSSQVDPANPADEDVFLSEQQGNTWSIPANISDTPGVESTDVTLTAASDGMAHVAWLERLSTAAEQRTDIDYSYGRGVAWSTPSFVASSQDVIEEPRLTTDRNAVLLLTWLQGQAIQTTFGPLGPGTWQAPTSILVPAGSDLRDIGVAGMPRGGVSVSWVQVNAAGAGEVSVYESSHASVLTAEQWLPLLVHP